MSKRFIDTEMFSDEWFSERSKDGKLAYIYLLTRCNHAGIWKVNRRLFKFETGIDFDRVVKQLGNRLVTVSKEFIFLPKFIHFQYPNWPNSNVKQQNSAIAILESFGITDINKVTVSKGLDNHYDNDTDNDIDTVTEKVVLSEKDRFINFVESVGKYKDKYSGTTLNDFIEYWAAKSEGATKFEFEKQNTWILSRRLATWAKNELKYQE